MELLLRRMKFEGEEIEGMPEGLARSYINLFMGRAEPTGKTYKVRKR